MQGEDLGMALQVLWWPERMEADSGPSRRFLLLTT